MAKQCSVQEAIDRLEREPLRHIVLLKHLQAYPEHVEIYCTCGHRGAAVLIILDASVSPFDRQTYPGAAVVAFISSDHPQLTASLMPHVPRGAGVVFKLSQDADLVPVEAHFSVKPRTAFVSFTATATCEVAADVSKTVTPSDAAFRLFDEQGHDQAWIQSLLRTGKAFACVLERDGDALSACFAFESYGSIWEVAGVVTAASHRQTGLGRQVVRTTLAELAKRDLVPRYQVEAHNKASIALANSVGLKPFLTLTHYAHRC
jgi:GNAT superfamily N-acetyltransferase